MKLILHILFKDLRRHRWEILLFIAVTAGWAWQQAHPFRWMWLHQRDVLPFLLFLLWFFIVVRVVQGERLVGDREFWPTRPYRWGQLMAAKALVLMLCLNGPLAAAQIYLLAVAGVPIHSGLIPGLIFLQLEFFIMLSFPAAVLAAVTETIVQWVMAVIGLILFAMIMAQLPWRNLPVTLLGAENTCTVLGLAIVVPLLAFVLIWQYARRRVWLARAVLAGAVLAVPAVIALSSSQWVRSMTYPARTNMIPLKMEIAKEENGETKYERKDSIYDTVITLPVLASSIAPDTLILVEGARISLIGDDGLHWHSEWKKENIELASDDTKMDLSFSVPGDLVDQLAQKHVQAKVVLALAVYEVGSARRIETASDHFEVPETGACHWDYGNEYKSPRFECFSPLRMPDVLVTRVESGDVTCPPGKGEQPLPAGHYAIGYEWDTGIGLADFTINPVHEFRLQQYSWRPPIPMTGNEESFNGSVPFCRGTPLTVHTGKLIGRMRITADLGSIGKENRVHESEENVDPDE